MRTRAPYFYALRAPYFLHWCPVGAVSAHTPPVLCPGRKLRGFFSDYAPRIFFFRVRALPGGYCLCAHATCSVPGAQASGVLLGLRPPHITPPPYFPRITRPFMPGGYCLCAHATCSVPGAQAPGVLLGHRPPPKKQKNTLRLDEKPQGAIKKRFAPRCFPALLNAVSSPRGALTAVFGMGTGVTPPLEARTKKKSE